MAKKKIMFKPFVESLSSENDYGLKHNYKQVLDFGRYIEQELKSYVAHLKVYDINIDTSKILLVGPRNEGELLYFMVMVLKIKY